MDDTSFLYKGSFDGTKPSPLGEGAEQGEADARAESSSMDTIPPLKKNSGLPKQTAMFIILLYVPG